MKANLYTNKKRWKWALAAIALLFIAASLWYTNRLVQSIAEQETRQVKMWAAAMEQQAMMMKSTEDFFNKVSEQEQLRVDLLANAYRRLIDISSNENTAVYLEILHNNISIPLVVTDTKDNILFKSNLPPNQDTKKAFDEEMKATYSKFPPIKIDPGYGIVQYLYYNESLIYTELKAVLEGMIDTSWRKSRSTRWVRPSSSPTKTNRKSSASATWTQSRCETPHLSATSWKSCATRTTRSKLSS